MALVEEFFSSIFPFHLLPSGFIVNDLENQIIKDFLQFLNDLPDSNLPILVFSAFHPECS